jgi:plasmid stabilization system protein ParE
MPPEGERLYAVFVTDRAEADVQNAALRIACLLGPDYTARWQSDLEQALAALANFPGPRSHARDEKASELYGYEVRRLLYFGPSTRPEARRSRRSSGTAYRVLFTILPPAPGETESLIRILRVLHGAQSLGEDKGKENGAS